ncbi:competence protein ComJ [Shewanella algae]|uniref:competence protein ComJ n=1 Tax=Shewanella algae TaxID=38313 RepID=UPI0031F51D88
MIKEYSFDLLISHNQVRLENRPFSNGLCDWGKGNLAQGCIIHDGFVVFDSILEGSFGANVYLRVADNFDIDDDCVRCVQTNFLYNKSMPLKISSAFESFVVDVEIEDGNYTLYFEIVEVEEVFYRFTIVDSRGCCSGSKYLKDDDFGGVENMVVKHGKFN